MARDGLQRVDQAPREDCIAMDIQNPFCGPKEVAMEGTQRPRWSRNPAVWFCVSYYALALWSGARSAVVSERSAGDFIFQVVLALCLGIWATADARLRQKPIPRSQQLWFFVLAGVVVPGYVIVTRGWKGLGWVVLHIVGWIVVSTLAMHMTGFAYFGGAWQKALKTVQ
jgi:hypothetical protein